ncbi:MAG TPA: universal stress protein [Phenylobacterium sp.]|uniref:universal stress protein n=1 Tax=Phenylobacterium sp. TaxID=1871053 RepID=UPI002B46120E|nr:universal stress protein [Phenylobacterium sp.]HKR89507.1 universal stress protein [Phenylobacterium sp.]
MSWARIMAPLSGGQEDADALAAGVSLAEPFGAELLGVYTPADVADVMPWMGDSFMGGVQATALESLKEAAEIGEAHAREAAGRCTYGKLRFLSLQTPVWAGLSAESRLSDVVVFTDGPPRGRGALAESFQQMVADEQRPVLVARRNLRIDGCIMVAWEGGKEASRAARLALPLLEKAARVVIVSAPKSGARNIDPARLQDYYRQRGVAAEIELLTGGGDVGHALLDAASRAGASILVAGAFGHTRLQEFIFGGTTRTLLNSEGPSLFLSH